MTVPAAGAGVAGVLIADPCLNGVYKMLVSCAYGAKFDTATRIPALLNAFVPDTDFWGILGDNFYDRDGTASTHWFAQLSIESPAGLPVVTCFVHTMFLV